MKRIEWIDASKGIGILLIMISHCIYFESLKFFTAGYIPLFFLLSGITFSYKKNSLINRLKRLLYPNYIYATIITFLFSIPHIIFKWGNDRLFFGWINLLYSRNRLFDDVLYGNIMLEGIFPVITWFLTAMSISYILFYGYIKISKKYKVLYIVLSLILISLLCTQKLLLPWSIDTALLLWLFILIGYKYKSFFINLSINSTTLVILLITIMLYCSLVALNNSPNYSIRYWGKWELFSLPICFIIGLLYTYIVIYIALIIKGTFLFYVLVQIGKISLILMCTHLAIFKCIDFILMINSSININIYVEIIKLLVAILFALILKKIINKYSIKYPILKWL